MTVKELVEKLSAMPQDVQATITTGWESLRIEQVTLENGPHNGPVGREVAHGIHVLIAS